MKQYILDTNTLISFLTDRNILQQEIISKYFKEASSLKYELIILDIVIMELVYVMENIYNIKQNDIKAILNSLVNNPGIVIKDCFNLKNILKLWGDIIQDFGDSVITSYAKNKKLPLLTFDKKFQKKLKQLKISAPLLK